jgi:hypothetical protein
MLPNLIPGSSPILGWRRLGNPISITAETKMIEVKYSTKASISTSSSLNIDFRAFGVAAGLS